SAGLFARGRKRDLPGSQAIRPVPMPRSPTPAEPTIPRHSHGIVVAAPALPTAKASAFDEFRDSITRLQHPLPTLHEWRCHHPCKACFRLAGSPLPGESRTLWIATKGFRSSILLFWTWPGAREVSFCTSLSLHITRSPRRRARAASAVFRDLPPSPPLASCPPHIFTP